MMTLRPSLLPASVHRRYAALPLCQDWSRREIAALDSVSDLVEFEPGDVILSQGPGRPEVVILTAGCARLVDLSTGSRLRRVEVGELVGHEAVLAATSQPHSLLATGYAAVLSIQPREFRSLAQTHRGLKLALTRPDACTGTVAIAATARLAKA